MPKVFIPQMPSRFDTATNLWIPTVNITPAKRFGDVVVVLPPAASRGGIEVCTHALRQAMEEYTKADFIVALGDPTLYAIAACFAAEQTGGLLRMLKWDRIEHDYLLVEVEVWTR